MIENLHKNTSWKYQLIEDFFETEEWIEMNKISMEIKKQLDTFSNES